MFDDLNQELQEKKAEIQRLQEDLKSKSGEQSLQTSNAKEQPIYGGEKEPKTIVWRDDDEIIKEQQ